MSVFSFPTPCPLKCSWGVTLREWRDKWAVSFQNLVEHPKVSSRFSGCGYLWATTKLQRTGSVVDGPAHLSVLAGSLVALPPQVFQKLLSGWPWG